MAVEVSAVNGFFAELKRRKVYRVAAAYAVVAWGIIQFTSTVFPVWELPPWSLRLVISLVLLGFPLALIGAWAFDLTPAGVEVADSASATTPAAIRRRGNLVLLGGFGIAVAAVAAFFLLPRAAADKVEKSIAVLPFESLSADQENAFFADGIQDDILTNLAKIGDLKVISRTSVMPYRGKANNLREIGKALGVSAILEGSVRKSGNRVRVNVQLINAANDEHLWAEDYDRDLTDVFAIQTDLAQKIAAALQAKLSPSEKAQLMRKPTDNPEAYLAFVQAHDAASHLESIAKQREAEQLYERAIQLDPNFAQAYAGYSRVESWTLHTFDFTNPRREKARALATRALQLQPDLPEGHLALGFSLYYGDANFAAALREFQIAQLGLPNDSEVYLALGAIQRRFGDWGNSNANLEKCASLSPQDTWSLQNLAFNYQMLHDWERALATIDRALAIAPNSPALWGMKGRFAVANNGDFSAAEEAIARVTQAPNSADKAYYLCDEEGILRIFQRRYADALRAAQSVDDSAIQNTDVLPIKYMTIGQALLGMGDQAGARDAFARVKEIQTARITATPDSPDARALLALALAHLGEREAAISEAQRAVDLLPVTKDAFHGPDILEVSAKVYAVLGDADRALQALTALAKVPNPLSPDLLRLDPVYDTIREDARFTQISPQFGTKF